jgi:ribosome-associated translation inhibitor RaiA
MEIQFNKDDNLNVNEELLVSATSSLSEEISKFSQQITGVDVNLAEEPDNSDGNNCMSCSLEARLAGMKPVAVTNHANTHKLAIDGAIEKLKSSLMNKKGIFKDL